MNHQVESRLPEPGETYEGFFLVRLLGAGAFAAVYEARSPAYDVSVAMKISRTPVTSEDVAVRALREIGVMSRLTNDHVARIHDHGMGPDERWYLVMEFLRGQELTDAHDFDRAMNPARAADIIHQACMGLEEAHRLGIVHRDLKPDNLWIERNGNVKVLDFGLARSFDDQSGQTIGAAATVGHMLIGTPHYSQPEQIQTGHLTPASDVYSLGIVLYEMLVARTPLFEDDAVSLVRDRLIDEPLKWLLAHVKQPLVPLTRYAEGQALPPELVTLVHACLAKDPAERPQTAGELANRLGQILHQHYGKSVGADLVIRTGAGTLQRHVLFPGNHRLGFGERCEVRLPFGAQRAIPPFADRPTIAAILHWTGAPYFAEVRALRPDGSVRVNGQPLTARATIGPDDVLSVLDVELRIAYPR